MTDQTSIFGNTISGNGGDGIRLQDSVFFYAFGGINGNEIGLDENETFKIANSGHGVNLIRSRMPIQSNEIGGNLGSGIVLNDSDLVTITGNRIGTKLGALNTNFGNASHGVQIIDGSQQNTIGTTNFIYYNVGDGIEVSGTTTVRNEITQNEFRANGGLPIDLIGADGPNSNDPNDGDTGGNSVMNYPVLDQSKIFLVGTQWTVPFSFDVDVAGNYRFEFYRYDATTLRHELIKTATISGVTIGASDFTGSVTLQNGTELSEGNRLSVLAVRLDGATSKNTSELSPATAPIIATPRIMGVTVSGTNPQDAPYALPVGSGAQIRSIPVSGINKFTIHFSEDVIITPGAFRLESAIGPTDYPLDTTFNGDNQEPQDGGGLDYEFNPVTGQATATFKILGEFGDEHLMDQVVLTIDSDFVEDQQENPLDGDWTNPTNVFHTGTSKTFPSGNSLVGGDFGFWMTIMPGDHVVGGAPADSTNFITQPDLDNVLLNWGDTPASFAGGDGSGNALVSQPDLDHVLLNWGDNWQEWQGSGGSLSLMSSPSISASSSTSAMARRADALDAIFESLHEHGMEEVWDAIESDANGAALDAGNWKDFVERLGQALDDYWGVA